MTELTVLQRSEKGDKEQENEDPLTLLSSLKLTATILLDEIPQQTSDSVQRTVESREEPPSPVKSLQQEVEKSQEPESEPDWFLMDPSKSADLTFSLEDKEGIVYSTACIMVPFLPVCFH